MSKTTMIVIFSMSMVASSLIASPKSKTSKQQEDSSQPRVFCMSRKGLLEAKAMITRNDPLLQASFKKLLKQADKALEAGPFSVMQKTKVPPSGDKHDYMSVPPYAGSSDGKTNPAWWQDYDRVPLERLTQVTETLALAYYLTEKQVYADRAALLLRVWFLNPDTRMNPDLKYAQASTRIGVIDTRFIPRIVDVVGLLGSSKAWTDRDQAGMEKWFREFSKNVRARVDKAHRGSGHNIASFYHVQMASIALFVGDEELADTFIGRTKTRIGNAINSNGGFAPELRRTCSLSYSCFHMYAMFNLATMGHRVNLDLWTYETRDGRSLRKALDFLAQYSGAENKKKWPYKEIEKTKGDWWDPYRQQLPSVLCHASRVYQDKRYEACAAKILGDELDVSRLQLMCGIPIRWCDTIDPDPD